MVHQNDVLTAEAKVGDIAKLANVLRKERGFFRKRKYVLPGNRC